MPLDAIVVCERSGAGEIARLVAEVEAEPDGLRARDVSDMVGVIREFDLGHRRVFRVSDEGAARIHPEKAAAPGERPDLVVDVATLTLLLARLLP